MSKVIDYKTIITPLESKETDCELILAGGNRAKGRLLLYRRLDTIHIDIGRVFYITKNVNHYQGFLEYCASNWNKVFVIFGNRKTFVLKSYKKNRLIFQTYESYGRSILQSRSRVQELCAQYNNVYYLENSTIEFPELGIHIAGCTLWANVSAYTFERMNDKTIKIHKNKILPTNIRVWNEESIQFIEDLPLLPDNKKWILITHHVPFLPSKTKDIPKSITDDGYYNDLKLDSERFSHVVYGHNHIRADFVMKGIRYLSNPLGYADQKDVKEKFEPSAHFTIET